jgi:Glycosyl hydrolases family 38 N-terminal domain/Glycosyl hydrolases family 38 C-terminal domain/Alpha mannosidase middle domain
MPARRVHYVLSTHWDREWYQTFQDYRYRLVRLLDRIIAGWERDELRGPFQTDGQAIILEDYLEVRPERRSQVERFASEGKFVIGPWYVLPDEFLVSGESLVRNIALGRHVARRFGGQPSNAGFLCDMFGHNSQIPQIFAGFGVTGGFIWRGTNIVDQRMVRWRGADGTELPCYRFGHNGYCSFASEARYARDPQPEPDPELLRERLEAYLVTEGMETQTGPMLAFDGGDHMEWDRAAYAVIAERLGQPQDGFEIVHTSLDAYLAEMAPLAREITTVAEGELREPGFFPVVTDHQWLIPGVGSSRVWIKQANAACQAVLCQWAEPFSALAHRAVGVEYPQGYLDVAWKWLLMNHPHDSICGCSIDAVHEDMKFRFAQAEQIGNRLTIEATRKLTASVQGNVDENEVRVTVFNPLLTPFDGVVDLRLEIPPNWPLFNFNMGAFQPTPAFRIYGPDGAEVAYQRLGQATDRARFRTYNVSFPKGFKVTEVPVALRLWIPALGYTTLTLRAGDEGQPTRHPVVPGLVTSERSMANDRLSVTIEPNGTLTLLDKRTGRAYSRLLTFEDRADIGDGWNHGVALNDQSFVSTACRASVALVHNGPELATFRVRTVMELPDEFDFRQMVRTEQWTALVIDSLVTLRAGADHVEVETTVHNIVKDHRLRVLFPTGAQANTYLADSQFDVVERPIALRADNHLYREPEIEAKPQQTWTAVFDKAGGLAVISTGLLESAVSDLPERPIGLTLFRATRRTVMTDGEPNGQLQGDLRFRYWIAPLAGEPDRAWLCQLGQRLEGGLRAVYLAPDDIIQQKVQSGDPYGDPDWSAVVLPPTAGFLDVSGPAVVTSLRRMDAGVELRMFNPETKAGRAVVKLGDWPGTTPTHAQTVNFEGQPVGRRLAFADGRLSLRLGAKKIVTLRLA